MTGGAVVSAVDWGTIAINGGLGAIAFLTATMITRFASTQKDHGNRLQTLERKQAVHEQMHRDCLCRRGGHIDA